MKIGTYKPSAEDKARERKYQAECDLRTLQEAERIKADRQRMAGAKKEATNVAREATKVAKQINGKAKKK